MRVRTATADDAAELLRLWNSSAAWDPLSPAWLREKIWEDPDFDSQACLLLEHGNCGGLGVGVLRSNGIGYVKLLAVHPALRRRGYGGHLLARLEQRLAEQGAGKLRVWESHPNYLQPGQDVRYTEGVLFLAKHGYTIWCATWVKIFPRKLIPTSRYAERSRRTERPC